MDDLLLILGKIESHLARMADAADLKVKRSTSKDKTTSRVRLITDGDAPKEEHFTYGHRLGVDVGREWGKFVTYCKAHGAKYVDFDAAFRNWIAKAYSYQNVQERNSRAVR